MLRHITINEHGRSLGISGERMLVREKQEVVAEYPLSRIKTISVSRAGVSLSSNLMLACAARGIKLFLLDFRGVPMACLSHSHQHAACSVREAQFAYIADDASVHLCRQMVRGKLRNQRAVLRYFGKYHKDGTAGRAIDRAAGELQRFAAMASRFQPDTERWRDGLMGLEGQGARVYWQTLSGVGLVTRDFPGRKGRGARDYGNVALNLGYAILQSYVWHCVINAGLEPYAGVLHARREGKPSLVLDMMEEYRPWVVDRVVIKNRQALDEAKTFHPGLRKRIIGGIHTTFAKTYPYHGRKVTLETILQRQVYRLAGEFCGRGSYRPYLFRW